MMDYTIPEFFPADHQAFIRKLLEIEHCTDPPLIEIADLRTLLHSDLNESWRTLKNLAEGDDDFEELFKAAYIHRAEFNDSIDATIDNNINRCEEIAKLANKLGKLLTNEESPYIKQELDGSTYYLLKEANLPHSVQHRQQRQPAATALHLLLKRCGNIIMRGFPRFSRLLEQLEHLALSRAEQLKEDKTRDKPKKLNQYTAARTYGLSKMAECISQGGVVNHSWLEPLVNILDYLYPDMEPLDINNARKTCKDRLKKLVKED